MTRGSPAVDVKFWLTDSVDVICQFRTVSKTLHVQEYSLDGLTGDESRAVLGAAMELAASFKSIVLISDMRGIFDSSDWDALAMRWANGDRDFVGQTLTRQGIKFEAQNIDGVDHVRI